MAKRFVKVSLATKLRILFGAAVLAIIAAALSVPWYFMELLAEQGVQRPAAELTRLRFNEFLRDHPDPNKSAGHSDVSSLYMLPIGERDEGRKGPSFVRLRPQPPSEGALDSTAIDAMKAFNRNPEQELATGTGEDDRGRPTYRCLRAVRVQTTCIGCHGPSAAGPRQFQPGELVGMIDVSIPTAAAATGPLIWWTRGAFIAGGVLATALAFVVFTVISQRLILRPLRQLRNVADKVAEGNLSVRSAIRSGDELQRLGDSFNEMLAAISDQHEKLRSANRALDIKLHELAEANITLYQANKVKSEFLTNVSHELRTPLNSIIGFADLVAEGEDARLKRYGQNIGAAAKSLLNMINDLLDLAKIEAGKADVRFDKVSVTDTCQTLLALMRPLADKKQLDLQGKLDPELPVAVTDAGKLQQILYNLLSNAVKFTPAGGKVILTSQRITTQRQGQSVDEIAISVADTGPGISEADQAHIFEKFYQADKTLTKEAGGTGLGLAIAKELTALLNGRLALDSRPGNGATFTIIIPLDATKTA